MGVIPSNRLIPKKIFDIIQKFIPITTIDFIFLRKASNGSCEILLIKRRIYPERGKWCLLGGRVLKGETIQQAINRQAKRELGVRVKILLPYTLNNPIGVFSDSKADLQKHFISLVYPVIISDGNFKKAGPEFSEAKWFSINNIPFKLGFNHLEEIKYAIKILKKTTNAFWWS